MEMTERIEQLVAPLVTGAGLQIVDVELLQPGPVLRLTVEGPDAVNLDGLGDLSRAVSALLDAESAGPPGSYDLEVSSPGLERRLRRPEHFLKAVGQEVHVLMCAGSEGERRVNGVLAEAEPDRILVIGERTLAEGRWLQLDEIERARTVFDWKAALAGDNAARSAARKAGTEGQQRQGKARPVSQGGPDGPGEPAEGRERATRR